ncbi:hypothetical protein ABPG72_013289 [Tetrahymena utriculariae]
MSDIYMQFNEQQMTSNKYFDCFICKDTLLKPVTLICGHSFCSHCIKNEVSEVINCSCPICKRFILVSPHEFSINLIMDKIIRTLHQNNQNYIEKERYIKLAEYQAQNQDTLMKKINKGWEKLCFLISIIKKYIPLITSILLALGFYFFNRYRKHMFKVEQNYQKQITKIIQIMKQQGQQGEEDMFSNPQSFSSTQDGKINMYALFFTKIIKYLFTSYIRLTLPV